MNREIPVIKEKLNALNNRGTLWAISDVIETIQSTLLETTGLKLKKDGEEINKLDFILEMKHNYEKQLKDLLSREDGGVVYQVDLEDSIKEIKAQHEDI